MSSTTPSTQLTTTRMIRPRLCGYCRQPGHDRRTCPDPEEVRRRVAEAENRRIQREAARERHREVAREREAHLDTRTTYNIHNMNTYSVYLYWSKVGADKVIYMGLGGESTMFTLKATPRHRIIAIPTSELSFIPTQGSKFKLSESNYFIVGDFNLAEFTDGNIHIIKQYEKPKTTLELWKECGLKSLFLLKEIERMGGKQYPNIEPMLDMVQDITLPPHTEMDKELAGVPSVFTNLT